MSTQPDILLIMPDQMRGDCLALAGHPVLRTPVLDEIGACGTPFTRAYSTCPSCIPARRALLTGQFPGTGGMVGFQGAPVTAPTLPQCLRDAGYATRLAGRHMHQEPYAEHAPCYSQSQAFHSLTDGRWKYIWRPHGGREQLFDLTADPQEERDLAHHAPHRRKLQHWRSLLVERLVTRPEGFSDGKRLITGRPYLPLHTAPGAITRRAQASPRHGCGRKAPPSRATRRTSP